MTSTERLISCLLVAHLLALLVAAIPGLGDFATDPDVRGPSEQVTPVTGVLDRAAVHAVWLHRVARSATDPIRRFTSPYVQLTSQFQTWNMFANPGLNQQVVRMGYRLTSEHGTSRTEFQNVFPAGPPDLKLFRAYFDSFTDKALAAGLEDYRRLVRVANATDQPLSAEAVATTLRPFTRYYGRQRMLAGLPPGTHLTAVEFWFGSAPIPSPTSGAASPQPIRTSPIEWELWTTDYLQ